MSAVVTLAKKDLLLLWRDPLSLFWMLGLPLVFAAFFGSVFGGSGPGKSNPLQIAVVADGLDAAGRRFAARLDESDAIAIEELPRAAAAEAVRKGRKLAWLEVKRAPADAFGMFAGEMPELELGIDPSRVAEQGLLEGLIAEATFAGLRELMTDPAKSRAQLRALRDRTQQDAEVPAVQKLALTTFFAALDSFLGTPELGRGGAATMEPRITMVAVTRDRLGPPNAYSISFPQSMLWGILGCAAGFAITLVRERSSGTMVRLLTAPITCTTVLAGKFAACVVSCLGVMAVMTAVGALFFGVRVGSPGLLALGATCAAACFAGLTLLLGSLARTEQAVSGLAWGILLVLSMLGGGMVPQIAMPAWMLQAGAISPARWTIQALEGAIWREFPLAEMALPCVVLVAIGAATFLLGAARLSRTP